MTDQINLKKVGPRSHKRARSSSRPQGEQTWHSVDAARFLYKGQCYDAGHESETRCELCRKRIRLSYVLKAVKNPSLSYSPEVAKLTIGECCFKPIQAVNEKLYCQLLAAAVNLRTYIEAIERDQRIFADPQKAVASEEVTLPRLEMPGPEEDVVRQLFDALVNDGGDHA
ncbi:MAG: hypothetical protein WB616_13090 [Candidatus Sulfotelmatobacter sp.]